METGSSCNRFIMYFVLFLVARSFPFDPFLNDIPEDEHAAAQLLEMNEIDSSLWMSLEPFYQRPIQVPLGELAFLHDVFPEIKNQLPSDCDILNKYLPWNDETTVRFLDDYPVVKRFLPIVRFNYRKKRNSGDVAFYLHHTGDNVDALNSARTTVHPDETIRLSGSIDFTKDYARWERRSVSWSPVLQCKIDMGNQALFPEKGLIYGYFPVDKQYAGDKITNWLYSESPTWNGIAVNVSPSDEKRIVCPSLGLFLHHRPTEYISGGSITVNPVQLFNVFFGITSLRQADETSRQFYVHGSLGVNTRLFSSEICGAFDTRHSRQISVICENRISRDRNSLNMTIIHFPSGFSAPRSALLRRFCNEMETCDTPSQALTLLRVNSRSVEKGKLNLYPQVNVWLYGGAIHHGKVLLKGEKQFSAVSTELALGQELRMENPSGTFSIEGEVLWKIVPAFSIRTNNIVYYSDEFGGRYSGTIFPTVIFFHGSVIEPVVKIITRKGAFHSLFAGYRQKVILFEKTFTEFYFEKSIKISDGGSYFRVEGNASFAF